MRIAIVDRAHEHGMLSFIERSRHSTDLGGTLEQQQRSQSAGIRKHRFRQIKRGLQRDSDSRHSSSKSYSYCDRGWSDEVGHAHPVSGQFAHIFARCHAKQGFM
jgi:hypothetical protein